jgi:hypothetical protein
MNVLTTVARALGAPASGAEGYRGTGHAASTAQTAWLHDLWGHDVIAHAFVFAAGAALALLILTLARSRIGQWIDPAPLGAQLRKLIHAGNPERAVKLCHAIDAPVTIVARAGLEAARSGSAEPVDPAGYRDAGAMAPAAAARAAMDAARTSAGARIASGFLEARVVGVLACLGGGLVGARGGDGATPALAVTGLIAALLVSTWAVARAQDRAMLSISATVEDLAGQPGILKR